MSGRNHLHDLLHMAEGEESSHPSSPSSFPGMLPVPRRTTALIVGHSIVFWAGKYATNSGWGPNLGLDDNVHIHWSGHRGLRWPALIRTVAVAVHQIGIPSLLIVQLGENDLPRSTGRNLWQAIVGDLDSLRQHFPDTHLVWSCLLERQHWRGAVSPEKVDLARRKVCKAASRFIISVGGAVVRHPDISHKIPALYRTDGVHLSDWGMDLWLHGIREALRNRS